MYQKSNSYDPMNEYTYWVYNKFLQAKMLRQNNMLKDYGPEPFVVDIDEIAEENNNFRLALWTGNHLQLALMSINAGEDIGTEMHPDVDQFICIEEGDGLIMIGDSKDNLNYQANLSDGIAVIDPAGKWHNLKNSGNSPIKLYTIYAPPQHPFATIHRTKQEAMEE